MRPGCCGRTIFEEKPRSQNRDLGHPLNTQYTSAALFRPGEAQGSALFGAQGGERIDAGRARGRHRACCQRNQSHTHNCQKIAHSIQWLDAIQRRRQRAAYQNRGGNTHPDPGRRRAADCLSGSSTPPGRAARPPPCAHQSRRSACSPGMPAFHRVPSPPAPPPERPKNPASRAKSICCEIVVSYCARWVIGRISGRFGSICCTTLRAAGRIASGSPCTRISTCISPDDRNLGIHVPGHGNRRLHRCCGICGP